jgi:hypothetical protein
LLLCRVEREEEDVVDSDFDIDENDEPVSDDGDDDGKPKRTRRLVTKAYKEPVNVRKPGSFAVAKKKPPAPEGSQKRKREESSGDEGSEDADDGDEDEDDEEEGRRSKKVRQRMRMRITMKLMHRIHRPCSNPYRLSHL